MTPQHKHRMVIRSFTKQNRNVIFFVCSDCAYMSWFAKDYLYNTIWKEGIRDD